ncbi:MAG TPA: FKBP-type peptidyl-prolyl cis-trans isomerase [Candidatus Absconditabacterales bacterium]|nr:FKBP-type peptidyl-prolyl cis-trans isomerase [Candidatus Absconditabacterales bacterium]HRU50481.1 FKBP-type peptidyl-prolyl cis-trans isomerase [Candidatus Absconditabacterales bacterium]
MKRLLVLILSLVSVSLILSACGKKLEIATGDKVTLVYDSFSKDGKLIEKDEKVTLVVGLEQSFPAFEIELLGMKKGQSKKFSSTSKNAYAIKYDNSKVQGIDPEVFSSIDIEPQEGETISLGKMEGVVIQVSTGNVFVDFNPTYTREDVSFKIKVLEVKRN